MGYIMAKISKKKLFFSMLGVVICVIALVLSIVFDPGGDLGEVPLWAVFLRYLAVSCIAVMVGLLSYIFSNKKAFWYTFGIMQGWLTLYFILQYTLYINVSITLSLLAAVVLCALIFIFSRDYKNKRIAINGLDDANLNAKEQKALAEVEKIIGQDDQLKHKISYLDKSIIVATQMGSLIQIIRAGGQYYFHKVGTPFSGIDEDALITDFIDVDSQIDANQKDYQIASAEIKKISARVNHISGQSYYGSLTIKLENGKTKKFIFINLIEEEELELFFGSQIEVKSDIKKEYEQRELMEDEKAKLNKINLFLLIYSLLLSGILYCICLPTTLASIVGYRSCV